MHERGRWPANVVLDEDAAALLDEQTGELSSGANLTRRGSDKFRDAYGDFNGQTEASRRRGALILVARPGSSTWRRRLARRDQWGCLMARGHLIRLSNRLR